MKSTQTPTYERLGRQRAKANDREQKEKQTTRARSRAEQKPDNNRPAPPRARPQSKTPTQETTPRQETDNLEISVQLSSRLFFEQRGNPKTPRLSQFTAIQNPSLKKSHLKFFQCDSTTVRRPLARIALLARFLCEARFHLADLAGYLAVQKLPIWQPSRSAVPNPIFVPFSGTIF